MILDTVLSTTTECPHHKKLRLEKEAAMHAAMGHGSGADAHANHKSAHSHHMAGGDHSLHDGMVVSLDIFSFFNRFYHKSSSHINEFLAYKDSLLKNQDIFRHIPQKYTTF